MGTKNNPGKFDCYEKADPDEPLFVLRANDPLAPILVEEWVNLQRLSGGSRRIEKRAEALECARQMRKWKYEQEARDAAQRHKWCVRWGPYGMESFCSRCGIPSNESPPFLETQCLTEPTPEEIRDALAPSRRRAGR